MSARSIALAAFLTLMITGTVRAQSPTEAWRDAGSAALEEIYEALRAGRVEALVNRTADRIDLTIFGSSELLSRSQARYVLKDFLRSYPPIRIAVHETAPSDGNWFSSASYWYAGGERPLTVYLRMRAKDAQEWELRELRFGRSTGR